MKKIVLIIGVLMISAALAMAGSNCSKSSTSACTATKSAKAMGSVTTQTNMAKAGDMTGAESVTLNVSKMTCQGCVNQVTETLSKVDGVSGVKVSLEDGTAMVDYDPAKVQPKTLMAAVVQAGYPTTMAGEKAMDASAKNANCDPSACSMKKSCDPAACGLKTGSKDGK